MFDMQVGAAATKVLTASAGTLSALPYFVATAFMLNILCGKRLSEYEREIIEMFVPTESSAYHGQVVS